MSTAAAPNSSILAAFRARSAVKDEAVRSVGPWFEAFLTFLACLVPVSVCLYLSNAKPLFSIKSVEFTQPDLLCAVLVLVVVLRGTMAGYHSVPRLLYLPVGLFMLSTMASAIFAGDKLRGVAAVVQIMEFFLVAWAFSLITSERRQLQIIHFTLGLFVFESLIAMVQLVTTEGYPTGTFEAHQQYGIFTNMAALWAFVLLTTRKPARGRTGYVMVTGILLFGALLGQGRQPWLAMILGGCAVVFYSGKRKKLFKNLLVFLLLGVVLVASVPKLRDMTVERLAESQTSTESENSLLSRLALWAIGYKLFISHPILGVGPKNYVSLVPHLATSEELMGDEALDPHNVWVQVLCEQGLVGFAAYVVLTVALLKLAAVRFRSRMSEVGRSLSLVYFGYMVFWFGMTLPLFMKAEGHITFLIIGLMAAQYQKYVVNGQPEAITSEPIPQAS